MNKCYMIVARDAIAQRRQALFDTLHNNTAGERVSEVKQLLITSGVGNNQTFAIS